MPHSYQLVKLVPVVHCAVLCVARSVDCMVLTGGIAEPTQ